MEKGKFLNKRYIKWVENNNELFDVLKMLRKQKVKCYVTIVKTLLLNMYYTNAYANNTSETYQLFCW